MEILGVTELLPGFLPDSKTFTSGSPLYLALVIRMLTIKKDNAPLLKNFEPIGLPPNLHTNKSCNSKCQ